MTTHVDESTQSPDRAVAAALAGSAASSAVVPPDETAADAALAEAALAWRWVVGTEALDLYARQDGSPHWRATCLAAGAALHRARVALAADGLQAHVTLLPEPSDRPSHAGRTNHSDRGRRGAPESPHLARLVVTGTIEITAEALALYDATDQTDSLGRFDGSTRDADGPAGPGRPRTPVPSRALARELVKAARAEGVRLRLIRAGDEFIGVMHGPDTGEAWLRAGMACSAVRLLARRFGLQTVAAAAGDDHAPPVPASPARPDRPTRSGRRLIGDREGWLNVGIGTPYLRLRLTRVPD